MLDRSKLTTAEADRAHHDLTAYRPSWCANPSEVTFLDVLRARQAGDLHRLSTASLLLAIRSARLDLGRWFVMVPEVGWLPDHGLWSMTRLAANWSADYGGARRTTLFVVTGLNQDEALRVGFGQAWRLVGSEGQVKLTRGGEEESVGVFSPEVVLAAIATALRTDVVTLEAQPANWIEKLLRCRRLSVPA